MTNNPAISNNEFLAQLQKNTAAAQRQGSKLSAYKIKVLLQEDIDFFDRKVTETNILNRQQDSLFGGDEIDQESLNALYLQGLRTYLNYLRSIKQKNATTQQRRQAGFKKAFGLISKKHNRTFGAKAGMRKATNTWK